MPGNFTLFIKNISAKRVVVLLMLSINVCIQSFAQTQIKNRGLENWHLKAGLYDEPDSFSTYVSNYSGIVSRTADAHSGQYAAKLTGNGYSASFQTEQDLKGQVARVTFWAKIAPNDTGYAVVNMRHDGYVIGYGQAKITSVDSQYAKYVIPVGYWSGPNEPVEGIYIEFYGPEHVGSSLYVDDISMEFPNAIIPRDSDTPNLIYPNPCKGFCKVIQNGLQAYSLCISDMSGKEVFSRQSISTNLQLDTRAWVPGMYVVKLSTNNRTITQKLIVQ